MISAAGLAALSAILGGAIALVARRRPAVLERTRTFAFAAAAGVVAFHLLPEVLPGQGLPALLWIAAGFALPWLLETAARALGPGLLESRGFTGARVAAEVGFAALIFHSVAEGLALVAALAQPRGKLDLEIALVAHHAPLTAAVVLPFLDLRGPRAVAARAGLVGAAGVAGVLASSAVPGFGEGQFLKVATAVTAGALLHVVADEIRAQRFVSRWERAADLFACAAGLLVAGLGAVLHLGPAARPLLDFARVLGGIGIACAPALLAGALAGALLAARTRFFRWDAFLLALVLLGPLPAAAFGALTLLLALPVARLFRPQAPDAGLLPELVDSVRSRAPPLLALLVVAAGLAISSADMPAGSLVRAAFGLSLVLAARLDEAGAVAVAAALVHKGFDPGLAVALLALGPATRAASVRELAAQPVAKAIAASLLLLAATLAAVAALSRLGLAAAVHASPALAALHDPLPAQAAASPLGAAAAAVLVALGLATLWSAGVRGWFAPLRHGPRTA